MQLTNIMISDVVGEDTKYVSLTHNDDVSVSPDVFINLTRDDLDAGEQATFDAFYAMMETKIPT